MVLVSNLSYKKIAGPIWNPYLICRLTGIPRRKKKPVVVATKNVI